MIVALCLVMTSILQFIDIPRPSAAERQGGGRPILEIARQPAFLVAVLAAAIGYAMMTFVMTATPLAMTDCGHVFADAAFSIHDRKSTRLNSSNYCAARLIFSA